MVPTTQTKIRTMAIKKQLRNVVFLLNKNLLQSCYCAVFVVHIAIGLRSRFTKIVNKLLDCDEFCTNKGTRRKIFGK